MSEFPLIVETMMGSAMVMEVVVSVEGGADVVSRMDTVIIPEVISVTAVTMVMEKVAVLAAATAGDMV